MDLIKSIQSTLYERIVSPLAGIFLMSWAAMHYELIMMLMSNIDMQSKTQYVYEWMVIDAKNNWRESEWVELAPFYFGLWHPLLYSFIALSVYSFLSIPAYGISMSGKYALQWIRRLFDTATPVSAEMHQKVIGIYKERVRLLTEESFKNEEKMEGFRKLYQESLRENEALKQSASSTETGDDFVVDSGNVHSEMLEDVTSFKKGDNVDLHNIMTAMSDFQGAVKGDANGGADALIADVNSYQAPYDENFGSNGGRNKLHDLMTGKSSVGYVGLLFDSENARLNQIIIRLAIKGGVSIQDMLLRLKSPATDDNINKVKELTRLLVEYHLLSKKMGKFSATSLGQEFVLSLDEGEGVAREFCMDLDDKAMV